MPMNVTPSVSRRIEEALTKADNWLANDLEGLGAEMADLFRETGDTQALTNFFNIRVREFFEDDRSPATVALAFMTRWNPTKQELASLARKDRPAVEALERALKGPNLEPYKIAQYEQLTAAVRGALDYAGPFADSFSPGR